MKNLVFDLDGTLWNTEPSYYYAFEKFLNKHPKKANQMKFEVVKLLKSITMDKMAPLLFPEDSDIERYQNMIECLKYSCEYLTNEEVVKENIINDIISLSKEYNLYIVSNCPFEYIDIFFKKTNLKNYFKDVVALGGFTKNNDFDKGNNLLDIINKHNLNKDDTFFIGDSHLDLESSRYASCKFIYLTSEQNVVEVINNKIKNQLILDLCDYYKEYLFNGTSVALMKNSNQKEYQYLFGFLNANNNYDNLKEIFKELEQDALEQGATSIVGPINYSTWFDYRLPIDNFDITLIPDIKGKKEDVDFFINNNYEMVYTYASTLANTNLKLKKLSSKNKLPKEYYSELVVGKDVFNYTNEIFEVSNKCFENGYLYSDVPFDVFNLIYMDWLKKLPFSIDLYMIRKKEDNKLVAFGICYFDLLNNMYVSKTAAILKEHQKTTVVMDLAKVVFERAEYHNANAILYHFQNEQKNTLSAFWRNNVIFKKRYALFKKELKNEKM